MSTVLYLFSVKFYHEVLFSSRISITHRFHKGLRILSIRNSLQLGQKYRFKPINQ